MDKGFLHLLLHKKHFVNNCVGWTRGFLCKANTTAHFSEALVLLKKKYFPLPTRAITLRIGSHSHLRPPALVGLSQKYFKRLPFCSIHDFKSEVSLDRGRLKVLDLILTTPIWWWVVRPPKLCKKIL